MSWESFFMGAGAGIVLMAAIGFWVLDWFLRGLEWEDVEGEE